MPEHPINTWHRMIHDRNSVGLDALLDENAVFLSPVVHAPQVGRKLTAKYLSAALHVFVNPPFHYVRDIMGAMLQAR